MKRNMIEAVVIGVVLTALSYVVGLSFDWIDKVNALEAFAVFTSYGSTYLCVVQRRWNYIFGAISTAAYAVVFWQVGLYASAILNLYLCPSLIYGWFRWRRDEVTRPVSRVALKWVPVYLIVTGVAYLGVLLIANAADATLPLADSLILVGSILAQFLLDNKKIETWAIWAVVNVFAIYTYFNADLALAGFQYIFFLANTCWGFYAWKKSMDNRAKSTDELSASWPAAQASPAAANLG